MVAVEVEKVYTKEAEKRMLAGKAIADPKVNLPEGIGQARDKAAEMLNVYNAVSEGLPNWQPLGLLKCGKEGTNPCHENPKPKQGGRLSTEPIELLKSASNSKRSRQCGNKAGGL